MSENKTQPTGLSVEDFLAGVTPARRREDALALDAMFREVTGWAPVMWGPSMIGYGSYHYRYESGREGTFLATGFAPRKANMVVYIMPGYEDFGDILAELGPHRLGRSCLYLGACSKVNAAALRRLVRAGLERLEARWPVAPS